MIRNIFIINNGIALVKLNFGDCHSLGANQDLIAGFISGLEAITKEITRGSSIQSLNVEDYIFYFFKDNAVNLLYVFIAEPGDDPEEMNFKLRKIASLFVENYKDILDRFTGEITPFNNFGELLIKMNLTQKNCGGRPECEGCPNSIKSLNLLDVFKENRTGFFKRLRRRLKKKSS